MEKIFFLIKKLFLFLKLFRVRVTKTQLSLAIIFGLFLGFCPDFLTLQNILILLALIFLRVPLRILVLTTVVSYAVAGIALDPLFHIVGGSVLELGFLAPLWKLLYQMPIVPFTLFNNSVVMGGAIFSLLLIPVTFFAVHKFYEVKEA